MIRIVKMTFKPDKVEEFKELFHSVHAKIVAMDGCRSVTLMNDMEDSTVFVTYSEWATEADLEAYRSSKLFSKTWAKTKKLFSDKPQAWSLNRVFR